MTMSPDAVFQVANTAVLPGWLLLVFAPRWKWASGLIGPVIYGGLFGMAYLIIMVSQFGEGEGSFGSLQGVAAFFENPWLLLAGWIHYLAFDLFVGCWEVRDARRNGISHLLVVPCLFFTFMLGPIGWLMYLVVRSVRTKKVFIDDSVPA
jgi:hypothetical protein